MKYSTNLLLDLCRAGIALKNEKTDTAARELGSFIVANSLFEFMTDVQEVLISRVELLQSATSVDYPQDMFDDEEFSAGRPGKSGGAHVGTEDSPEDEPPPMLA